MQEASSGSGGWPKKSKLAVEEGEVTGLTAEDDFSKADSGRNDALNDVLGGFSFDS